MAKVNLRAYHNEIDTLINRGQIDLVIAHCKHILQIFPKSIDTYRLLGKAFLEEKRYTDATDIFLRVLSAVPDDFVSQLGLSIIREDEGNIDAAIWHMERAFEIQPFNFALQEELRRLFERRDGSAPPRIRLTRAALARMYAKGNLYQQAIAETRAVLARDPQRIDMRMVLGLMYLKSGKNIEAAEISSKILQKLPYCLEANRILVSVLSDSDHKDDYKLYKSRLIALDPYEIQKPDNILSTQSVNNDVVQLEKLEVDTSMTISTEEQADWMTSLGLSSGESEGFMDDEVPDWLIAASTQVFVEEVLEDKEEKNENLFTEEEILSDAETDIDMVEWLGESVDDELTEFISPAEPVESRNFSEYIEDADLETVVSQTDEDSTEISEIDAADLPEWLMGLAPDELESQESPDELQISDFNELEDFDLELEDIIDEKSSTIQAETDEATLESFEQTKSADISNESPEWLTEFAESAPSATEIEESPYQTQATDQVSTSPSQETESELPEWLKEFDEDTATAPATKANELDDIPEWLREIGDDVDQEGSMDLPTSTASSPTISEEIISQEPANFEEPPDFDDADQALAWLAGFAATQEIKDELDEIEESSQADTQSAESIQANIDSTVDQPSQLEEITEPQVLAPSGKATDEPVINEIDLNLASLVELERLPGVGYVIAQNIISYRETHGDFSSVDQLADVPGIDPDDLFELGKFFYVSGSAIEPESRKENPTLLNSARKAWSDGDTQKALDDYQDLIKQQASLDDVIFDLNKLLQNKNEDIELWQTLGDAYMRNNQLIEAMQAYNKAEELLK